MVSALDRRLREYSARWTHRHTVKLKRPSGSPALSQAGRVVERAARNLVPRYIPLLKRLSFLKIVTELLQVLQLLSGFGATGTLVKDNLIGTNAAATADLGNAQEGSTPSCSSRKSQWREEA